MKYPNMDWGRMEAVINKLGGMEGVEAFLSGKLVILDPVLLAEIESHTIPATTATFECTKDFAPLIWEGFEARFIGQLERPKSETIVVQYRLKRDSRSLEIVESLGGPNRVATSLVEIKYFIDKEVKGETGVLLNNGRTNVFFAPDNEGVLCSIVVRRAGVWIVDASPVIGGMLRYTAADRVFSRN